MIVLRAEPGHDVPVEQRVKRWLKSGLRGYGIRCESVSSTTPEEQLAASRAEVLRLQEQVERLTRSAKRQRRVSHSPNMV